MKRKKQGVSSVTSVPQFRPPSARRRNPLPSGLGINTNLALPAAVATDALGSMYIADPDIPTIRMVAANTGEIWIFYANQGVGSSHPNTSAPTVNSYRWGASLPAATSRPWHRFEWNETAVLQLGIGPADQGLFQFAEQYKLQCRSIDEFFFNVG